MAGRLSGSYGENVHQNYPNPFNPETRIEFEIDRPLGAQIMIHNTLGQVVAVLVDKTLTAGSYAVTFHAGDLPSGVYFARLSAGGQQQTLKMVLMK